jgi:hypothetical protein
VPINQVVAILCARDAADDALQAHHGGETDTCAALPCPLASVRHLRLIVDLDIDGQDIAHIHRALIGKETVRSRLPKR